MIIFKRLLSVILISVQWAFSVPGLSLENTSAGLVVKDELTLNIPTFGINPSTINVGENLAFTTTALTYSNGAVAIGIPCELRLQAPDSSAVVLSTITNSSGICSYNTSNTLAAQVVTLVSGDVSKLNNVLGNGSGVVAFLYQNQTFLTNNATYTVVNPLSLNPLVLAITPPQVYVGGTLVFASNPITLSNATLAVGVPCTLVVTTPTNSAVSVSGVTGSDGVFRFNSASTLNSQNLALNSGTITDISGAVGNGNARLQCTYNTTTFTSNIPTYTVIAVPQAVIPSFTINPDRVQTGESIVFAGDKLLLDNGTVLNNIPCTLNITTPNNSQIVLTSQTNSNGVCAFNPTISLSSQNWTLVSGDLSTIYGVGFGTGYIQYLYNSTTLQTPIDTYEVYQLAPLLDVSRLSFQINPESALLGTQVVFKLNPVYFDNGDLAIGLVCRLQLVAPDNSTISLAGVTGNDGSCEFIAPDQRSGLAVSPSSLTIASGNPLVLNTFVGGGSGFAEIEYNNTTSVSPIDTYAIFNQTNEENTPPETTPEGIIKFITNTPRTGGIVIGSIIAMALLAVYLTIRAIRTLSKK